MARDFKVSWSVYLELPEGYGEGLQGLLECIPWTPRGIWRDTSRSSGVFTLNSSRDMARDSKVSWSVYLELPEGYGEELQGLLECIPWTPGGMWEGTPRSPGVYTLNSPSDMARDSKVSWRWMLIVSFCSSSRFKCGSRHREQYFLII